MTSSNEYRIRKKRTRRYRPGPPYAQEELSTPPPPTFLMGWTILFNLLCFLSQHIITFVYVVLTFVGLFVFSYIAYLAYLSCSLLLRRFAMFTMCKLTMCYYRYHTWRYPNSPHLGMDKAVSLIAQLQTFANFSNIFLPQKLLRELEGVSALLIALKDVQNLRQFLAIIFLYFRDRFDKSVFESLKDYILELFSDEFTLDEEEDDIIRNFLASEFDDVFDATTPDEEYTPHVGLDDSPKWLEMLRLVSTDWQSVRTSAIFPKVAKLISVLVMAGLCDASNLNFSIAGFKLLDKRILTEYHTAPDALDAVLSTIVFFAEGGYKCFKTNSIRPLLVSDNFATELDDEYVAVISMWDLVRNGNLEKCLNTSEHEFDKRLEFLTSKVRSIVPSLNGSEKKLIVDRYTNLLNIRNSYTTLKISGGTRKAPYAIQFYGDSSQGKTTLSESIVDLLLQSAGLPCGNEYRAIINPSEKYMSTWTTSKLVAIVDDIANEKSAFAECPPTRTIINLINNQIFAAPIAELEGKGKRFVEPEIVIATTNKKDLDAGLYSNCPYSIQRRMNVVITVRVKRKFQLLSEEGIQCGIDSAKVRKHYTVDGVYTPPTIDDIWVLNIERAVKPRDLKDVAKYEYMRWNSKPTQNMSSADVVAFLIEQYETHRENQTMILEAKRHRAKGAELCKVIDNNKSCCQIAGLCPYHPQIGFEVDTMLNFLRFYHYLPDLPIAFHHPCDILLKATLSEEKYVKYKTQSALYTHMWTTMVAKRSKIALLLASLFILFMTSQYIAITVAVIMLFHKMHRDITLRRAVIARELLHEHRVFQAITARYKETSILYMKRFLGIGAVILSLAIAYRHYRRNSPQGNLVPKTEAEVAERDGEINIWSAVKKVMLPISSVSKCVTLESLKNSVKNNTLYGSVAFGDKRAMVNGVFVDSNVVLIPKHYFDTIGSELDVIFVKNHPGVCGEQFRTKLGLSTSIQMGPDLMMCFSPTGGSFHNIIKHFPLQHMPDSPFHMLWRCKEGTFLEAHGRGKAGIVNNGAAQFQGHDYNNLDVATFEGMCGAVLVSETRGSVIMGLHLGGLAGKPKGCSASITQSCIYESIAKLRKLEGVIISGSANKFEEVVLGKQLTTPEELHAKSPIRYMPHDSQVSYFGSCIGRATHKSDVKETIISDAVTEVCGIPNTWMPPKMDPQWFGWQTALAALSLPAASFSCSLLERSILDYKSTLFGLLIECPFWKRMTPLSDTDTICGQMGKRFIDAIKAATAIGYPLTGPKIDYMVLLEPTEDTPNLRDFVPAVWEEINRCLELYKQGLRAYCIAKACKKDEILDKEKCRIFYGNPIALTFLIRKYYLPILRFLQMNPISSECAVGVNCHGPEWEQLAQFMNKFGEDRVFAGDYSKYDQRIPSQMLFAALRILIDIAKECDYSEEDIVVMEAMTGDIVFAYIAFNGDLISLNEGAHISGNSLTVILNGIVGSLNLRCCYFTMYPNCDSFRKHVAIMTYGDDNKGSVSKDRSQFNIKACSEFLGTHGQIYTMPDKESELVEYMKDEETEFLKRKSVYHSQLGCRVGALADASIFKSLHNYLRTKTSPLETEACAMNIDTALREWFNHGPTLFEKRRIQMKSVAEKCGITHLTKTLNVDYKERACAWHETHTKTPGDAGA